jgi:hypothetical protein
VFVVFVKRNADGLDHVLVMRFIDAIETIKEFIEPFEERAELIIFVFFFDNAEVCGVKSFHVLL